MRTTFETDKAWKPVNIGAGGWLVGIDVAPDGTMVVRTDTYGAYLWNGSGWTQLATAQSMPQNLLYSSAVYEIRVSPSHSNIFYMQMSDGLYKTTDKGASWTKTNFPVTDGYTSVHNRADGQKMAIDPKNPDIVFTGTQKSGFWVTRDGGVSWQKIDAIPQGTNANDPGMTGITIQGSTIFVGTAGAGVYQSVDGGYTWKAIGGPADISHAAITKDGTYFASDNSVGALWKFSGGTWTKVIVDSVHAVATNPFNAAHIIVTTQGGSLQESLDGGATWSGWQWRTALESSNDIPWLENSGLYMSTGGLVFDPLVPGKLWQSAGVGVWETQLPNSPVRGDTLITWNSHSRGIEQLVANEIVASAGANPVFASWDRPFFEMSNLDEFATSYSGGHFSMGWSVDYASSSPQFLVGISDWWGNTENSGFSTDGGKTWQKFEGLPSWAMTTVGGSIAASTTKNFIWVASGNQPPAYTLDGGKTWANISIPGISDWSQVHPQFYLGRTTITADRVSPNTFYLYDSNTGVYRTTDGGVNWTKMHSGQVGEWTWWNAKIEAVPGSPGELYFTSGPQGHNSTTLDALPLMHSKDGGATWQALSNVKVATFGFGAPAAEGGPATIFVAGYVNNVYGIWYSADSAKSWTKIGEHPMGSLDLIKTISGDMDNFGMVYVGFGGSGFAYYDFSDAAAPPTGPTPPPPPAPPPPPPPPPPAPTQTGEVTSALDDVGAPATVGSGAIINDSTPVLSGTLSSALATGQKLAVFRDGQVIGHVTPGGTSWSFADPGASDGKHDYSVRVVDQAGQMGASSSQFSLTIDTVAPGQLVLVTGAAATGGSAGTLSVGTRSTSQSSSVVSGTVTDALANGESLIVLRDGVAIGTATVSNKSWTFNDSVQSGSFQYSARVQDAAGNLGALSNVFTASLGTNVVIGTNGNDTLVGTLGEDIIWGVLPTGTRLGRGTIDVLSGMGGNDIFVLGDSRGRFYDDGAARKPGLQDYALIRDFQAGDKLQLKGTASEYLQGWISNLDGVSGTGIYHDTNRNGVLDRNDELIALVQNHGTVDASGLLFV